MNSTTFPYTPLEELNNRISRLQSAMAAMDMGGALIVQQTDLFYFSGSGQDAHLFVPVEGPAILMVRKDFGRAREDSPLERVVPVRSLADVKAAMGPFTPKGAWRLGLELDVLPVNNFRQYEQTFDTVSLVDASLAIKSVRMIKSEYELGFIRQAAELNAAMFGIVADTLKEGMTELEFCGLLEAFLRKNGHQGLVRVRSFNQDVFYGHIMSGVNLAVPSSSVGPTGGPGPGPWLPHGAGLKTVGRNEPVQIDYVGVVGGYMVDQARTFFLGEPAEPFVKTHELALKAQQTLADMGKAGVPAEALYDAAMEVVRAEGREEGFMGYPQPVPFVGHGVGLELDELPLVGRRSAQILEKGMVIALEPKFILPGKGLAGIENTFLVTESGLEKITIFDDAIQVLR